jgi:hypothetical protein
MHVVFQIEVFHLNLHKNLDVTEGGIFIRPRTKGTCSHNAHNVETQRVAEEAARVAPPLVPNKPVERKIKI